MHERKLRSLPRPRPSAARIYFPRLHPGLNRRSDDPFNSVLNYGYAIMEGSADALRLPSLLAPEFVEGVEE